MRVVRGRFVVAALLVLSVARGAEQAPPMPPSLPGAIADASGMISVIAQEGGDVAGVELSTGRTLWRSAEGRWPLASATQWVAVAAPDGADRSLLHVRFLRPSDGKLLMDAKPIRLSAVVGAEASWEGEGLSIGAGNTSINVWAWVPPPRGFAVNARSGLLRVRWKSTSFIGGGGMRPPEPGPTFSGLAFIDPASGAVEAGADDPAEIAEPAPPTLPSSWKREPGMIYWSWTSYGSSWTDKPRTFWLDGTGVAGFFGYESSKRRLLLHLFGLPKPLPPVEIAVGDEWAPQVSMDGRYLILSRGNAGVETFTLYDLIGLDKPRVPTRIPHLEPRFRSPFSVIGASMYYVAEDEGRGVTGGTAFPRWLVCVDWERGKIRWTHALPPRVLPAPMAAAGPGLPR
jgi:hypothetical protein